MNLNLILRGRGHGSPDDHSIRERRSYRRGAIGTVASERQVVELDRDLPRLGGQRERTDEKGYLMADHASGRTMALLMFDTISASVTPVCASIFFHSGWPPNADHAYSRCARSSKPTMYVRFGMLRPTTVSP